MFFFDHACQYCKLGDGLWWSFSGSTNCKDSNNPCDTCECKVGNGKPAELIVQKDGCKLPAKCAKGCLDWTGEKTVGDQWDCWHHAWR